MARDGGQVVVLLVTRVEVPSDTEMELRSSPYSLVRREAAGVRRMGLRVDGTRLE